MIEFDSMPAFRLIDVSPRMNKLPDEIWLISLTEDGPISVIEQFYMTYPPL